MKEKRKKGNGGKEARKDGKKEGMIIESKENVGKEEKTREKERKEGANENVGIERRKEILRRKEGRKEGKC